MRTDPRNPQKPPGAAVKSGFTAGRSARGKSHRDYAGNPGTDVLPMPRPQPHPSALPGPVPYPGPRGNPARAPSPAAATGGRVPPPQYQLPPGVNPGPAYQPPGVQAHELLSLLARALSPDAF